MYVYKQANIHTPGVSLIHPFFFTVSQLEAVQGLCRDVPTVTGVSGQLQARVCHLQEVPGGEGWEGLMAARG